MRIPIRTNKIVVSPQNLFYKIIEEVPEYPCLGELCFSAEGIDMARTSLDPKEQSENKKKYERKCLLNNILPYTRVELRYNTKTDAFERQLFYDKQKPTTQSLDPSEFSLDQIISGGKPDKVNVSITDGTYTKIKDIVGALKKDGYHITRGELIVMSTSAGAGFDETKICIGDETVRLEIEHTGSKIKKLENWFNMLKKDYGLFS